MNRVMFYCQHCVGFGHLVRSSAIVRALARDFSVMFVTGGPSVTGFELPSDVDVVRLPEIEMDAEFECLEVCDSALSLEETKALRKELLIRAFDSFAPDAIITELYPFGRKRFAFELIPLLERARSRKDRTAVVSSVRDVLVAKKDEGRHEARVCKIVNKYYDLVLVHGDERLQRLEETFPRVGDLNCPVAYTGYVVRPESRATGSARLENSQPTIIVSAGGGKYPEGHLLLESVILAAGVLEGRIPHKFHIFTGPFISPAIYQHLHLTHTTRNVTLDKFIPDLADRLRLADLSISLGGYNTIMDILCTGVRALILPVTSNGDTEQTVRGAKLKKLGVIQEVLRPEALTPEPLAAAILEALMTKPGKVTLNLDGAENSASLLKEFLRSRSVPDGARTDRALAISGDTGLDLYGR